MTIPTYRSRWPVYAKQWDTMQIKPSRLSEVERVCHRLIGAKVRYQAIEKITGVPWYMIAAIHERESSQDFSKSLAQGDPWNRKSTHVPRGRGPFASFEEAAVDALRYDGLTRVKDWRLEKTLYYLEFKYNGSGYFNHGIPSPYIFGATTIQRPGKYVSDGPKGWRPNVMDTQIGCAAIIRELMMIDPTIKPIRED